ncbi:hypothetical protein PF005_g6516 [Phytophthora fragariae]|uniref:Uncharacterized protein n=1 Tax=Phytophthora fragariae TaxID=53985 RepID=A0A6A3FWW1_9STRA|nr:hypothetical protein PF003_g24183 [Phytophthora fragariae]KAE8949752.1 hypothetical protein PF009_g725 [Phytophthora fragariae]KAE9125323.1 hypothetical protein PF007_g6392 [Phytophthora fragariae]KAE9149868.1 hypothetical protein PF006_g5691 [Phytophthora fragariae]KAE9222881.1 hypothetical protein PF005_g6516 [Phytophthora fragariae]
MASTDEGQHEGNAIEGCIASCSAPLIDDRKRNWAEGAVLAPVRSWREVEREGRREGEKASQFTERICAAYKAVVKGSPRSPKAIDDKMQALKEMYRTYHRIKSPNISQRVFDAMDSFLSGQADTSPLRSSFSASVRLAAEDTQCSSPDALFGDDRDTENTEKDPHNTGRKSGKRKRTDKYEQLRDVLKERSQIVLAQARELHDQDLRERRQQHSEHMALLRELLSAFQRSSGSNDK